MVEIEKIQDLEALRARAVNLDRSVQSLLRENAKLRRENLELRGLNPQQIALALTIDEPNEPEASPAANTAPGAPAAPPETPKDKPKTPRQRSSTGRTTHPRLERRKVSQPLEPATCKHCSKPIKPFDSWDTSETVTVTRTVYEVVLESRQKGRCGCPDKVHTAPSTVLKMRSGGRYSVELTANVAVNKWCDHLPLERQARRMARLGLDVTPQALFDQASAMADELRPFYSALIAEMLASPVLGIDETTWRMLHAAGAGSEYRAAIGLSTPTAAGFIFDEGKSADLIEAHINRFSGTLVCDGFKAYSSIVDRRRAMSREDLVLAHCWAHAFRRFREAAHDFPVANQMMTLIGELYEIDERAGPFPGNTEIQEKRARLRSTQSTQVLQKIRRLAMKLLDMPKDLSIRKAAAYLISYWAGLIEFVRNPNVPLDNNGVERDLRQLVQGRKNHYGSGSQRGLDTTAVLYSLIQTCLKLGVDPELYLVEAIRRRRSEPTQTYLPRHALADQLKA
jgi:transposase